LLDAVLARDQLKKFQDAEQQISQHISNLEKSGATTRTMAAAIPASVERSAFLDILTQYYDVNNAPHFQTLFGHLTLGKNPTPLHSSFRILRINFAELSNESREKFDASVSDVVRNSVKAFLVRYELQLDLPEDGIAAFNAITELVQHDPHPVTCLYSII
jgi:hypothetical protein